MAYPVASNEKDRLRALEQLGILQAIPNPTFERLCKLARDLFRVEAAVITFLDQDTQWFGGCVGLNGDRTPRSSAFCNYTVLSDEILVVEDASKDPRFSDNPLVTPDSGIRFYAGAPLALEPGKRLGSLCLVGTEPRAMTSDERLQLKEMAALVVEQLELHRSRAEAKRHRDALSASEERLRLAVAATGIGIWEYGGPEGTLTLSSQVRAILGYHLDQPINPSDLLSSIHGRDRRRLLSGLTALRRNSSSSMQMDFRVVRPSDKEERWVSVGVQRITREHSLSLVGTVQDVTDLQVRARQQQGLALLGQMAIQDGDASDLLQACCSVLVSTLGLDLVVIGLVESAGSQLSVRAGGGRLFKQASAGFEKELKPYLLQCAFVAAEPVLVVNAASEDHCWKAESGDPLGLQSAMAVGIGSLDRRYGAISLGCADPRRFASSELSFLQAAAFILAGALERREVVASLRLRERALEAAAQGIVVCDARDPNLPLVYVNPAVERQTGYDIVELNARGASILLGAQEAPATIARWQEKLASEGHFSGRVLGLRRDGKTFEDEVSVSTVRDEAGLPTHLVAVHTDVTDRLRLEAELKQTQKMDAIGKLTGGVAHDFNNLLTVILGNSEIIAEAVEDAQLRALAEMIVQAAERGADTVQRLLAFGRRQDLQPEQLDVNAVLAALTNLLKRSVGEEIMLRTRFAHDVMASELDKSQFETAILNLVINARDAMPRGGTITLSTSEVILEAKHLPPGLTPGSYVAVRVTDTGEGISPDQIERVFEPFFTTKEVGRGTGLGLSMVYGFVQQSGGYVRIESELGRGTRVEMLLPRAASHREAASGRAVDVPVQGRERILVVEDQDDLRTFVTAQLASLGYDVASVRDGVSALEHIEAGKEVDLLFTDVIMPGGLDGIQLAERASQCRPDLRVLFTTGYSDLAVERGSHLLDAGTPVLKKPYRRSELSAALRVALSSPASVGR